MKKKYFALILFICISIYFGIRSFYKIDYVIKIKNINKIEDFKKIKSEMSLHLYYMDAKDLQAFFFDIWIKINGGIIDQVIIAINTKDE